MHRRQMDQNIQTTKQPNNQTSINRKAVFNCRCIRWLLVHVTPRAIWLSTFTAICGHTVYYLYRVHMKLCAVKRRNGSNFYFFVSVRKNHGLICKNIRMKKAENNNLSKKTEKKKNKTIRIYLSIKFRQFSNELESVDSYIKEDRAICILDKHFPSIIALISGTVLRKYGHPNLFLFIWSWT